MKARKKYCRGSLLKFFLLLTFLAQNILIPQAISASDCQAPLVVEPTPADDRFVQELMEDSNAVYDRLRQRALAAKDEGLKTFSFLEMAPTLRAVLAKIDYFIASPSTSADAKETYRNLLSRGLELQSEKIPYQEFIRWSMQFIESVDREFRRVNPQYTSYYHQNLAKNGVEDLLEKWPNVIVFPSFQAVGFDYFFKTRNVPVHIIGFSTEALFADGYMLTPAEFAYHDWGHIEFLSLRDIDHLTDPYAKLSNTLKEWKENREDFLSALDALRESDRDLFRGVQMTFFEVLHERGYPYDLFRLKAQFETSKWTEILHRKLTNNFWKNIVFTPAQLSRLDEARAWLLSMTKYFIEKRNLKNIHALKAESESVRIRLTPPVQTFHGYFDSAFFDDEGKIWVNFKETEQLDQVAGLYDVSLAQISDKDAPNISLETIALLEKLLWVKWKATRVLKQGDTHNQQYRLVGIKLNSDSEFIAQLKDQNGSQTSVPLNDVIIPYEVTSNEFVIKDVEVYKLRQLLSEHKAKAKLTFIVQEAQKYFEGNVAEILENNGSPRVRLNILGPDSSSVESEYPLSDLSFFADGPLLFSLRDNQTRMEQLAKNSHMLMAPLPLVKSFSNSNILFRLSSDVSFRDAYMLLPNELVADQLMEALIAVRTLKSSRARVVRIVTNNYSSEIKLNLGEENYPLNVSSLFHVAGADKIRLSGNRLHNLNSDPKKFKKREIKDSYVMSLRSDDLGQQIALKSDIKFWATHTVLPENSQIYLVIDGGMNTNEQVLRAMGLAQLLRQRGNKICLISPYLPYARSDKIDEGGGIAITGRLIADLLEFSGIDFFIFMRAHAPQSIGFYSKPTIHLSSRPTLIPYLRSKGVQKIIAPDEGAQKEATLYAKELKIQVSTVNKHRDPFTQETQILGLTDSDVKGMVLAIVDDELDTGGTASSVIDLLFKLEAKQIFVVGTHHTGTLVKVLNNPNLSEIVLTDSVVNSFSKGHPKVIKLSIADEISEQLKKLEKAQKISELR